MKKFALLIAAITLAGCALVPQENALVEIPTDDLPDDVGLEQPIIEHDLKLGLARLEDSVFVNLSTGETQQFLPEGYELLGQHSYMQDPNFLLLRVFCSVPTSILMEVKKRR